MSSGAEREFRTFALSRCAARLSTAADLGQGAEIGGGHLISARCSALANAVGTLSARLPDAGYLVNSNTARRKIEHAYGIAHGDRHHVPTFAQDPSPNRPLDGVTRVQVNSPTLMHGVHSEGEAFRKRSNAVPRSGHRCQSHCVP